MKYLSASSLLCPALMSIMVAEEEAGSNKAGFVPLRKIFPWHSLDVNMSDSCG